ncbi:MAG: hypothetical protein COT73_11490 [Bdellovibrio sp. CG10_big_fil_rev_8_21_14_0_10_47_8]|nr:MAG: hypothetical protein COT73_11490 [Bdellovibrio sp. CG10_big_fil_rev_8_21_14_0_10_47_8]
MCDAALLPKKGSHLLTFGGGIGDKKTLGGLSSEGGLKRFVVSVSATPHKMLSLIKLKPKEDQNSS